MTSLKVKLLLATLMVAALAASHFAVYQWGRSGANAQCSQDRLAGWERSVKRLDELTAEARGANQALAKVIHSRQQYDDSVKREIRHALQSTAHLRVDCVFDDGVMHILDGARIRANQAATGGIGEPLPTPARAQ